MTYRLTIHKIDQSCLFELAWGKGQRLTASLTFPAQLLELYETWRRAYLGYYNQSLRGRVGAVGHVAALAVDWHSQLVQAEARLLSEFHTWLKHSDLYDLREELRRMAQMSAENRVLFLTCTPLELSRLPWETWEFGPQVQIVRSPATIQSETLNRKEFRRGKARVLAILGDDTGLDFADEQRALNGQKSFLDVHYVGWQPGENAAALKQRICLAIADPQGWDVLFFAGHSNEAVLLDGQISIAPFTAIAIKELSPYLHKAQQRGLQFALFNSCSGLDIAQGLVSLGLSQVAVMREPIHNEVAQVFLVQLVQRLARYQTVQEALQGTCQFFKLEQNLTYPSAYLVPSLFRHPESVPYQLQPAGWRKTLRRWQPTLWEMAVVGAMVVVSLLPPLQDWLLSQRVLAQAVYRDVTAQIAPTPTPSPILLVRIDDRTLQERRILSPSPIDRTLLADLVTQLGDLDAEVVGIDYLLDRPTENDALLRQALEQGVEQDQQWFVLATKRNDPGEWLTVHPGVAANTWSLEGDIRVPWWHVQLRGWSERPLPFSYQLAIAHHLSQDSTPNLPYPDLQNQKSLQSLVESHWEAAYKGEPPISRRANLNMVTNLSRWFYQRWLHPILDFSIPPAQVYQTIPAWQLLQDPDQALQELKLPNLQEQVVIIMAGGYDEVEEDSWALPAAVAYWRGDSVGILSGGEAHAYMAHHFLTGHLVMPVPDVWMVLAAAVGGKAIALGLGHRMGRYPVRSLGIFAGATAGYGLLCLQLYVSGLILLPWLLPSVTTGLYFLPFLRKHHGKSA